MLLSSIKFPLRRALQIICAIAFITALFAPDNAISEVSIITSGAPNRGNPNGPNAPSSILPAKIIGTNRFVVGFAFRNFNPKKIYPYFSVDIQNSGNPTFHPRENHHVYSGIMLLGMGKLTHKRFLKTVGTVLIVDDMIEHVFNVQSALGFVADRIDHNAYAQITSMADKLFGQ
jgi:hypothetical protein